MIDYDRLTLGSPPGTKYVSFNNVRVGQLIGSGVRQLRAGLARRQPNVVVMHGDVTDNNATLFAQGYYSVLNPLFSSGKYKLVTKTAGTWKPPQGADRVRGSLHGPLEHQLGGHP